MIFRKTRLTIHLFFLVANYYLLFSLILAEKILSCVERFDMIDRLENISKSRYFLHTNSYQLLKSFTLLDENNVYRSPEAFITLYGDYISKRKFLSEIFNSSSDAMLLTKLDVDNDDASNLDLNKYQQFFPVQDKNKFDYLNIMKLSLKPSRMALHETIVSVVTQLQLENEKDMQYYVMQVYARLKNKISHAVYKIDAERQKIYNNTISFDYSKKFSVALHLKLEKRYYAQVAKILKSLVAQEINFLIKINPEVKRLQISAQKNRMTFFQVGAPGSGKSTLLPMLQDKINRHDIQWKNIVKIDPDHYHSLLKEQYHPFNKLHAQIVGYEVSLVKRLIQGRLIELLKINKMPHVLFDQVYVIPEQLIFSLAFGGKVEINIISAEVNTAIMRCCERGERTGRYLSTADVLYMHKHMIKSLFDDLIAFQGENIFLDIWGNNGALYKSPDHILHMDIKKKQFTLHNEKEFNEFLRKFLINHHAQSVEEIYFNETSFLTASILQPFKENSFFRKNSTKNNASIALAATHCVGGRVGLFAEKKAMQLFAPAVRMRNTQQRI